MRNGTRPLAYVLAGAFVASILSACAGANTADPRPETKAFAVPTASHASGVPSTPLVCGTWMEGREPCTGWAGPGELYVVAWAGSSCPYVASDVTSPGQQQVNVELVNDYTGGNESCTADHMPMTSRVPLPVGVSESLDVIVVIEGEPIALPPRSG